LSVISWGVSFRRAEPSDGPLALVLALGAASALALAPLAASLAPYAPPCPFHALTGLPCVGCGTTRALVALARGDVLLAIGWNPLTTMTVLAGGAACALLPLWVALRQPLPVLAPELPRRARLLLVALLLLNWAYLAQRGV
jgi:hypothetical protein